jgi:hypothetical protein
MKKYIFTESQIKKIINNQVNEQYGHDGSAGDVEVFQFSLNKYFKAKNIRAIWDGSSFNINPKGPLVQIAQDGAWGQKSSSALKIFQEREHLKDIDGIVGCESITKLHNLNYLTYDIMTGLLNFLGLPPCHNDEH